jgi:hypothetical protein
VNDGRDGRGVDADGDGGDAAGGDGGAPAVGAGGGVSGAGGEQGATPAHTHEAALRGAKRGRTIFLGVDPRRNPIPLNIKDRSCFSLFFALFDWVTQRRRIYILLHKTPQ